MLHEQTMQGHSNDTDFSSDPVPGTGNRNTDFQDSGKRGFYNRWDGGGAGGWHNAPTDHDYSATTSGAQQSYVGRGPRNYKRTDERILEEVHRILTEDDELDASDVEVAVQSGEVTLSGIVHSRQARRRAEELLDNVFGVSNVSNKLKINQASSHIGA